MFKSITLKLFVQISLAVVILFAALMALQSVFFENYYLSRKMDTVEYSTQVLVKAYTLAGSILDVALINTVTAYSQDNNLEVFFVGEPSLTRKTSFYTGTTNTQTVTVTSGAVSSLDYDLVFLSSQMEHGREMYLKNKLAMDAGKTLSYTVKNNYGNTSIITVSSIVSDGQPRGLLYVFASLQPVGEATSVVREYSSLYFIGAFVIILIFSFLFSRQVARPLLHINKVAAGIADLDFSQECMLQSKDELGNLSRTINRLSNNLHSTIADLKESNRMLAQEIAKQKELEESRKLFVAGVSHELKTPISVVRGYAEGLMDGVARGQERQEYAQVIIDETEKMSQIVSDMLDLAQMEAGKYQLQIGPISLNRMIKYELKKFAPVIAEKNLALTVRLPDEPLIALGDGPRIEQVLTNLFDNACRYTPPQGQVILSVRDQDGRLRVELENECPEISAGDLAQVWDDFFRVEKSRDKALGGTGLGLTVVRHILELHGCPFGVEKTKLGVKFFVELEKKRIESGE
jgi:signal transduction histidine kinase